MARLFHSRYKVVSLQNFPGPFPVKPVGLVAVRQVRSAFLAALRRGAPEATRSAARSQKETIVADALTWVQFRHPETAPLLHTDALLQHLARGIEAGRVTVGTALTALETALGVPLGCASARTGSAAPPSLKLALSLFLLRGSFEWVPDNQSEFITVLNKNARLEAHHRINCWESVFAAGLASGALTPEGLKHLYAADSPADRPEQMSRRFGYTAAVPARSADAAQPRQEAQFIFTDILFDWMFEEGCETSLSQLDGMDHVMVSVPYSEAQLLQAVINQTEPEPDTADPTVFSHYDRWTGGQLGTLTWSELMAKKNGPGPIYQFRIRPVKDVLDSLTNV